MKIASWNVNGIRSVYRKGALQHFIQTYDPDILCLQETKATQSQSETDFENYDEYWNSAEKKGYSGTAIFTKHAPLSVIRGIPSSILKNYTLTDVYGDLTKEGRVLTLEFEYFFVTTVYTPNAKDDLSRIPMREAWDPCFLTFVSFLNKKKPVIFCGDFNVAHTERDLARPNENRGKKGFTDIERRGIDEILKAGFVDTFREFESNSGHYTWWSHFNAARERNIGWRIDYVFISSAMRPLLKRATIENGIQGSDHCPVTIELIGIKDI